MDDPSAIIDSRLRAMRVFAIALTAGAVLFAIVATIATLSKQDDLDSQLVSLLAAGMAVIMTIASLIVPGQLTKHLHYPDDADELSRMLNTYQLRLIMGLALLEGAAFFNLIALIIEGHWWSLGIALLLVLFMLARFPTHTRIKHWIEARQFGAR